MGHKNIGGDAAKFPPRLAPMIAFNPESCFSFTERPCLGGTDSSRMFDHYRYRPRLIDNKTELCSVEYARRGGRVPEANSPLKALTITTLHTFSFYVPVSVFSNLYKNVFAVPLTKRSVCVGGTKKQSPTFLVDLTQGCIISARKILLQNERRGGSAWNKMFCCATVK